MNQSRRAPYISVGLASVAIASLALNAYLLVRVPNGPVIVEPSRLVELTSEHFPNEFRSLSNPQSQKLAFLLSPRQKLQAKAVTSVASEEPLEVTLQRAFPTFRPDSSRGMGATCFPEQINVHGQFCVVYAVVASS